MVFCTASIRFFQSLNKNMLNGTLEIRFFIDISWRCLKTLIAQLLSENGLMFKFRNRGQMSKMKKT